MLIKFLPHGCGDASKAAAYVLDEADHLNVRRAGVSVLRGNLQLFAAIANNLPFRQRYTSGVIAWSVEDAPTDAEIEAVLDEFERVAFVGLDPDEYQLNAVQHIEPNGSKHVHILIPRVNLRSRKSLNIAPPGWEGLFYPLRNAWNNEQGWARPDDPLRERTYQSGYHAYIDAAALRAGLQIEPQPRTAIAGFIKQKVKEGLLHNRDDILLELKKVGEITRDGIDYISVKPDGFKKGMRLEGALFKADFDAEIWIANEQLRVNNQTRYSGRETVTPEHQKRAKQARRELADAVEKRRQYHHDRYHRPTKGLSDQSVVPDHEAVGAEADPMVILDQLQIQNKGNIRDRTRENSHPAAQSVGRAVRAASDGVSIAAAKLRAAIECHERATERDGQRIRAVARESDGAARIIQQLDELHRDELVRFKTDISLIAVAKSYGYLPQKIGSTPGGVLLKKGPETLLCVTNSDNDYQQYYNLANEHDSGSVVDFVQRREPHLNLWQIRRKLRPYLNAMTPDRLAELKPRAVPRQHIVQALEWHRLPPYQGDLLQHQFHIDTENIEVFADKLRQSESGQPCFRNVDRTSIVGYEIETGAGIVFSTSGPAGLFTHRIGQDVDRVVIVNSAVEAMAYHQLNGQENTVYIGFGNALSQSQLGMLFAYFARKDRQNTPVIIALPRTEQAQAFAEKIQAERPSASCVWPNSVTWSDELGRSVGKKPARSTNARVEVRHDLNSDAYPGRDFDVDW